ncbi:MAG TPA: cytochrome c biogenesis protein CcdA [Acidimicrobiia bacterium]
MLGAVTPSNVTILLAFGGGILSFVSPCVLPLVPSYLGLITGLSTAELAENRRQHLWRIALNTALFTLGMTTVFVLLGLGASAFGQTLRDHQDVLVRASGGFLVLLAVYLAGSQLLRAPGLYGEARLHLALENYGALAVPVAGAAFGFAWTPCIGPVLGSVLTVAATTSSLRAVSLLAAYGLGLGASFLVIGLGLGWVEESVDWLKRHGRTITFVSAGLLAAFGLVLLFGQMPWLNQRFTDVINALGLGSFGENG